MEVLQDNVKIWDQIYSQGHLLWYPYELVVRIVHDLKSKGRLNGIVLDHGCGSGNHLELLCRLGINAIGTEVSPSAATLIKGRFSGAKLSAPPVKIFDPKVPLSPQLPKFDHLLAWVSTHYNRKPKFLEDLSDLIGALPAGGSFIFAIPGKNDVAARMAKSDTDGTMKIEGEISSQKGALITVPENKEELLSWCKGIEVEDIGQSSWTLRGVQTELHFVVGKKKHMVN